MKLSLLLVSFLIAFNVLAEREIIPTDFLKITGEIEQEFLYDLDHLDTFTLHSIPDQILKNQEGEIKKTVNDLKGILLTDLLNPVKFKYDKPRELNTFVFRVIASDGYTVIFSWNELYNTLVGRGIFLVTSMNGKNLRELNERILLVSTEDIQVGRRFVKCVQEIRIERL